MKLEAGIYVRTKYGVICKILKLNEPFEDDGYLDHNDIGSSNIQEKDILKASYNIIDLIEVGDYVNGHQVYEVDRDCHRITLNGGDIGEEFRFTYLRPALGKNMGIKSIVTHEQFESMKYEV